MKIKLKHLIFIFCLLITGGIYFFSGFLLGNLKSYEQVRKNFRPSDIWIVDRNDHPMESIRTSQGHRSLDWIEWRDTSPAFQKLLIETEDHRFYSHFGVDFLALAKASWDRLVNSSERGASTITMQLAGLLENKSYVGRKSIFQKVKQIVSALRIESAWSKFQILDAYINLVSFRGELIGLRAVSLGYFKKNPIGLNQQESALLVSLLRSPNANADFVAWRACLILKEKNCDLIKNLARQIFSQGYQIERSREVLPVLAKNIIEESSHQSVIKTSVDERIQKFAIATLREQLRNLKNKNVHDGAVLVIETKTGRVAAYVANAGAGMASQSQIDGVQMRRQAGSIIKPFVYASAIDLNLIQANSLIEDSPADITISDGRVYHPKNYDYTFRGLVSAGEALGSSLNVPAVKTLRLVGEGKILDRLRKLGFDYLQDDEYYGPSLALGAIDLSLWELTQGYKQFSTNTEVFLHETRKSIFNILASPEYRRFTFGMDSALTLPFAAAVKTGTSKDMRDNWCIGWTSEYTVGVWVGNFNGDPMRNVSGMTGAAPIWRSLMLELHPNPPESPESVSYLPPAQPLIEKTISRIRYPADKMLVGLDPDIPTSLQKLPIEIENPQKNQEIFLNQKKLSHSKEIILWPIQKGKYKVDLRAASGEAIDSVDFEVR